MKKLPWVLTAIAAVSVSFLVVFVTFIHGKTSGPDLIEALQSGKLTSGAVESIEVVAPLISSRPFNDGEYARLKRLAVINTPAEITRLLENLSKAERCSSDMNHPVDSEVCYLRINTKSGFYWVYCDLLDDGRHRRLALDANTMNATNPNGSQGYFLNTIEDVLAIVGWKH